MYDIERELIEVTGYEVKRKFSDRQDYLKSLFSSVQKLTDDDFDNLSDDAAAWANACVEAHNSKRDGELPDFDEIGDPDEDESEEESETDDETADASDDTADEDEESSEEESSDEDADEEDDGGDESDDDGDEEVAEDEPEQVEMDLKPSKKKVTAKKEIPSKPVKKPVPKKAPKPKTNDEDVVLDKWGSMEGSKNSQALKMFEKGATAAEVKAAIGGTYYNILGKMTKQGHKLTKTGSLIKLTHMSEKESKVSSPKRTKK